MLPVLSKICLTLFVAIFMVFPFVSSRYQNNQTPSSISTTTSLVQENKQKVEVVKENIEEVTEDPQPSQKPISTTVPKAKEKTLLPSQTSSTTTNSKPTVPASTNISFKENIDFANINEKVRASLVNILCNTAGNNLSPITGSGVVVSPDGVILTNAHIAQYFLLKDFNGQKGYVDCVIRTGSPAYPLYRAKIVYISSDWILNNKTILIEQNPKGTGEFDYAFLKITERIDKSPITSTFPFIKISLDENIKVGSDVLLGSYPAGFLGGIAVVQYLYQSTAMGKIADIFTFKESTIDLISVPGTILSQKGSSGGVVVSGEGEVVGLISTSGDGEQTKERDLRAITGAYINRDLKRVTGEAVTSLISNADSVSNVFATQTFLTLEKILTNAILGR